MKVGGLFSMTASNFIMRDVLIRYNKGERIRLTHLIVFEVNAINIRINQALIYLPTLFLRYVSCVSKLRVLVMIVCQYWMASWVLQFSGDHSSLLSWAPGWVRAWFLIARFFFHVLIYADMSTLISVRTDTDIYLAAGNIASCTAQGFLDAFFYGSAVFMNAILAFTHCVMVKRGRKDEATGSLWIVSAQ